MTISIMWRSDGRIHMASDSRITFGNQGHSDVGIKVIRLPIRILGTEPDKNGEFNLLFDTSYGFCYAGNLANASTFVHLVEDLLRNVQYVSEETPLSFEEICKFFCRFSAKVSTEIVSQLFEKGRYTFFLAGYCPLERRIKGAKFNLSQNMGKTVSDFQEVLQCHGDYTSIGDTCEFTNLMFGKAVNRESILLTLNRLVDEQKLSSVGGDIQYGSFTHSGRFAVSGLVRISEETVDIDGKQFGPSEQRIIRYRGFELYDEWNHIDHKFWPSPTFVELKVPSNYASNKHFLEACKKSFGSV